MPSRSASIAARSLPKSHLGVQVHVPRGLLGEARRVDHVDQRLHVHVELDWRLRRGADVREVEARAANHRRPEEVREGALRVHGDPRVHRVGDRGVGAIDLARGVRLGGEVAELAPVGGEAAGRERRERDLRDRGERAARERVHDPLTRVVEGLLLAGDQLGEELGDEDRLVPVVFVAVVGDRDRGRMTSHRDRLDDRARSKVDDRDRAVGVVRDEEARPVRRDRASPGLVADRDLADHREAGVAGERDDGHGPARPVGDEGELARGIDRHEARGDAHRDLRELREDVPISLADLQHREAVRLAVDGDHELVVLRDPDGARAGRRPEALLLARLPGRRKRQQEDGACEHGQAAPGMQARGYGTVHGSSVRLVVRSAPAGRTRVGMGERPARGPGCLSCTATGCQAQNIIDHAVPGSRPCTRSRRGPS